MCNTGGDAASGFGARCNAATLLGASMNFTKWGLALALLSTGLVAACATTVDDGTASSSELARSATCPAELQRCGHTFTFPDHGESSVELRGDFGGAAS